MILVNALCILEGGPVSLAEMIYSTNIIAVVGKNAHSIFSHRKLTLWNTNTSRSQYDIPFTSNILGVKMNKKKYSSILL